MFLSGDLLSPSVCEIQDFEIPLRFVRAFVFDDNQAFGATYVSSAGKVAVQFTNPLP
jgi:hypothetical protein